MQFAVDWKTHQAAVWRGMSARLKPITALAPAQLNRLIGIDTQKNALIANTRDFVQKKGGTHALLWGARGCGKSTLIRALLPMFASQGLRMVQIDKRHLDVLEELVDELSQHAYRFIIFCDDLSFEGDESSLPGLKVLLEGSLEAVPENLLFYASSNRRHLLPEERNDNAQAEVLHGGELHHGDRVEQTLSLADRFGLWLSFYSTNQQNYLQMVEQLLASYDIAFDAHIEAQAVRFARLRGVFSGRTANHFIQTVIMEK